MPAPKEVTVTSIRQVPYFTPGGTIAQQTLITFTVLNNGPFTLTVPLGSDTPEYVNGQLQAKVDYLKQIGVIA